ncbi:MAG: NAD-dependent epimerase/dehydratase family protein [Bdellovibrionales bacterium]
MKFPKVAITGGGGYVGSALVPFLVDKGYEVTVLDTFWYGDDIYPDLKDKSKVKKVKGDIRNPADLKKAFEGQDAVLHLACISNDPSFEMQPNLGKSINYDCFADIMKTVKSCGVKRFIYASSSSVYGVKDTPDVTEDAKCEPLTDYSKFKWMCEEDLKKEDMGNVEWSVIRPATVCGYAPRLRLDLTVNILTISALAKKKITVHGGGQLRPNLNVRDMIRAYAHFLMAPKEQIHRKIFNVGFENRSVGDIAEMAKRVVNDPAVELVIEPTHDHRSYHVNSDKVAREVGFKPEYTIEDAIRSLVDAYKAGKMKDPVNNPMYYNIKRMKELNLENA